jgi:hypothetical protein
MTIHARIFTAPDDTGAAQVLGNGRDSVPETETQIRDQFLASSALTEWESTLTGRSPEDAAHAARPRVAADDRPDSGSKIFAAPPGLRAALAAADRAKLTETAQQWVDQYGNIEPGEVSQVLCGLSELAKSADAAREELYFWMR